MFPPQSLLPYHLPPILPAFLSYLEHLRPCLTLMTSECLCGGIVPCRCISHRGSSPLSEQERQATIARNRELLAQLGLADAASAIKSTKQATKSAKPVQPRVKKPKEPPMPTRQSTRLRRVTVDPNESPQAKRKREVRRESEKMKATVMNSVRSAKRRKEDRRKRRSVWKPPSANEKQSDLGTMILT